MRSTGENYPAYCFIREPVLLLLLLLWCSMSRKCLHYDCMWPESKSGVCCPWSGVGCQQDAKKRTWNGSAKLYSLPWCCYVAALLLLLFCVAVLLLLFSRKCVRAWRGLAHNLSSRRPRGRMSDGGSHANWQFIYPKPLLPRAERGIMCAGSNYRTKWKIDCDLCNYVNKIFTWPQLMGCPSSKESKSLGVEQSRISIRKTLAGGSPFSL